MGALQSPTQGWLIRRRLQRKPWPLQSSRSASCTPSRSTLRRWAPLLPTSPCLQWHPCHQFCTDLSFKLMGPRIGM